MVDDFEIDDFDFDFDTDIETRYINPVKSKEIPEERLKYADAKKLARQIVLKPEMRAYVIVSGSFYFGDFLEALITIKNIKVKTLTVSTLSMNENNVDSLANLMEGGFVDELNLIVSDYFFSHERHNLIPYIYKELDKDNKFQLAAASTHCKIAMFETSMGNKMIIHGSANLRSSSNIEQFVIEENKELYDFNFEIHQRIVKQYKTINKSIRNNQLWQMVAPEKETAKPAKGKLQQPKKGQDELYQGPTTPFKF